MKTQDILKKLEDDSNYYGDFGKQYLSNSDIGTLLSNPKDFRKSRPDNKNFAEGRYFHQLLLEPEKAEDTLCVDVSSRNSKAYKEFIAEHEVEVALLSKECANVIELVKTIRGNIFMFDKMTEQTNEYEKPAVGMIKGMQWKGKADILCDDCIIDLKTSSNINDFKWSARKYNYDSQCYIYQQLFGKPLVFYVIDKGSKMLGVYEPSEEFVQNGMLKVDKAIEVYNKFFGDNPTDDIESFIINETL